MKDLHSFVYVDTNKGENYYNNMFSKCRANLDALRSMPVCKPDVQEMLEDNGLDRRDFLKWVSATTASLMLPAMFEPLVAEAAELMNRLPVIWIELQDCAGNSEAILRSTAPTVADLIMNVISLEYQETLMAAAGFQADKQLEDAAHTFKGKYVLCVEGAIPMANNGMYGTIGASGETFEENLKRLSNDAAAVIALGACAAFGGVPAASPNPTGAVGVSSIVKNKPIINIPACPANPDNIVGTILLFVMTGQVPELDALLRPKFAFGRRIHDNCERRAHFDAGEFVQEWGDTGAKENWCLYKMGCKGPMTFNNCSLIKYNQGTSWPIQSGHGCIGCSEPDFWDKYAYERPMPAAHIKVPGGGVEKTVDEFGLAMAGAVGVGIAVHAAASAVAGKKSSCGTDCCEKEEGSK